MEWDWDWNAGAFTVLAISALGWGALGFLAFAFLVLNNVLTMKGQQVFWGLVIVSLVVWASLYNTFSPTTDFRPLPAGPGGQPYEDQFFAP
jgi:hypothetical protein